MAYLDIASNSCYGRYNKKFANVVGLITAVYWSAIMEVLDRVREKKTYDENGYFKLNRKYIEANTSLNLEQQYESDAILIKLGLLEVSKTSKDQMRVDIKGFFQILTEEDPAEILKITTSAKSGSKKSKAEGKRQGIITRLLDSIAESEPDTEIFAAYQDMLEVCYDKGLQKVPQLKIFKEALDSYTDQKEVKLKILSIATSLGYRDCSWAISQYEKSGNRNLGTRIATKQTVSTGINTDLKF